MFLVDDCIVMVLKPQEFLRCVRVWCVCVCVYVGVSMCVCACVCVCVVGIVYLCPLVYECL